MTELVDLWRKDGRIVEMKIYELLGRHPRIVTYLGHDPVTFELLLQRLPKGNLDNYLQQHPEVSFQNRIAWAIEIAQGITYLHSKDVVWNDTHLGNVLVTDDLHVVLCDFGGSCINPGRSQHYDTSPPLPYVCPNGYYGPSIKRQDIFGFGVMLFVFLSKRYPHCPTRGFAPPTKELIETFNSHQNLNFDILPDAIYPRFAQIVMNCFNITYPSAAELLLDLEEAYSSWIQDFEKVCSLILLLYPAFDSLGRLQGDVQDPDLHICIYDPSATTAARGIRSGPPIDPSCYEVMKKGMDVIRADPRLREILKSVEETSARMRQLESQENSAIASAM